AVGAAVTQPGGASATVGARPRCVTASTVPATPTATRASRTGTMRDRHQGRVAGSAGAPPPGAPPPAPASGSGANGADIQPARGSVACGYPAPGGPAWPAGLLGWSTAAATREPAGSARGGHGDCSLTAPPALAGDPPPVLPAGGRELNSASSRGGRAGGCRFGLSGQATLRSRSQARKPPVTWKLACVAPYLPSLESL